MGWKLNLKFPYKTKWQWNLEWQNGLPIIL